MRSIFLLLILALATACTTTRINAPPIAADVYAPAKYDLFQSQALPIDARLVDSEGRTITGVTLRFVVADTTIADIAPPVAGSTVAILRGKRVGTTHLTVTLNDSRFTPVAVSSTVVVR